MGLLDDAIREHLDLKRRRGGDPTEIARQEQEALGPVRREPEPEQEPDAGPAQAEHREEPPTPEPPPEPEQEPEQEPEPMLAPAPEERAEAVDPRHSDIVHQPTTEFHVEDHDDDREEPDEDVLEETPEFLQETPEHDRLWFEQRPPRDFDFDD